MWRDTPARYGRITRGLHWLLAALILWQFLGMAAKLILGRVPLASFFVGLHAPVGLVILLLVVLRLVWALHNRRNRPDHSVGLPALMVRAGHGLLYGLMLVIPSLALLRAYGAGRGFSPFGLPLFPATGKEIAWMVAPANLLHGPLGWFFLAVILVHVFMVALHERVWRDGTMARMAGRPPEQPQRLRVVAQEDAT